MVLLKLIIITCPGFLIIKIWPSYINSSDYCATNEEDNDSVNGTLDQKLASRCITSKGNFIDQQKTNSSQKNNGSEFKQKREDNF